jgi:hypothetical protein
VKKGSYLAIAAGLGSLAVIAFYLTRHWPQKEAKEVRRDTPISGMAVYATAPVAKVNFPTLPTLSKRQLVSGNYETVSDVNLWPDVVKEFYGIGNDSPSSGMANPGGVFNESDSITNDKLPSARLILAAVRRPEKLWIVQYEYGGRAHGYQVNFLTASATSVRPIWRCYLDQPLEDIQSLMSKVRSGACKNTRRTQMTRPNGLKSVHAYDAVSSQFAGKERDSESGLDNFGARYFGW